MAYNLSAVMKLHDRFSTPLKEIKRNVEIFRQTMDQSSRNVDMFKRTTYQASMATTAFSSQFPVLVASASLATAALAPLSAGALGLASSFGAAASGMAAFGIVASSSLSDIFEAADEVEKINEQIAAATTATEYANAQKDLTAVYSELSAAQAGALQNLQEFRSFWDSFKTSFDEPVFEAFSGGLRATKSLLEGLKPTITGIADVTTGVMSQINRAMANGSTNTFFSWLENNAARSVENFAAVAGNAFLGVTNILDAFAPTGAKVERSLVGMSERFREWSDAFATSQSFKDFMDYANQNGKTLLSLFSNLTEIAGQTVTTLAPFGTVLLSAFEKTTGFITEYWPLVRETMIGVTTAVVAFNAASTGLMIYSTIAGLMANYAKVAGTVTVAQWALNLALNANPFGLVAAGIAAVVTGGVLLYRSWDGIRDKAVELWDTFGGWKSVLLGLLGPVGVLINGGKMLYDSWEPFRDLMDGIKGGWNSFTGLFSAPDTSSAAASTVFSSSAAGFSSYNPSVTIPQVNGSHYNGLKSVPYDGYCIAA